MQTLPKILLIAALCVPLPVFSADDQCTDTQSQFNIALALAAQFQARLACYETVVDGMGQKVKCAQCGAK